MSVAGYSASRTLWYGEYAYSHCASRGSFGSPYSSTHVAVYGSRRNFDMSYNGTIDTTTRKRSGRWVTATPVSSPPLEAPTTASWSRVVVDAAIRASPTA